MPWKNWLVQERRPKIGIVWSGQPNVPYAAARDIPFETLLPLLKRYDCRWVSLQYPARPNEVAKHIPRTQNDTILDSMASVQDLADTAGLIQSLDLVITAETVVSHLAGALGKPVWLMSRFDNHWVWFDNAKDTAWYPSMRIFGQTQLGDWTSVIQNVTNALDHFLSKKSVEAV